MLNVHELACHSWTQEHSHKMLGLEENWNRHGEKARRSQQQNGTFQLLPSAPHRALHTQTLQAIHSLCINLGREALLVNMKSGGGSGKGRSSRELRKPSLGTHRAESPVHMTHAGRGAEHTSHHGMVLEAGLRGPSAGRDRIVWGCCSGI